jgi:hypothetical protein
MGKIGGNLRTHVECQQQGDPIAPQDAARPKKAQML